MSSASFEPGGDLGQVCPGREDRAHPGALEGFDVTLGDYPAHDDDHVLQSLGLEPVDNLRHQSEVRPGQKREADRIRGPPA